MLLDFRMHFHKAKALYRSYERALIPGMLFLGFVVDYITFKRIQISIALTVLFVYFVLAGIAIAFTHYYDAGRISDRLRFIRLFSPLVIQYTFGALLGASLVFYWYSASFAASWPFIALIAVLMVSNEALRKHITQPRVQLVVYYFIAFSFFSIAIPYLFNGLDARLFLLAGAASLVFIHAYIRLLALARGVAREQKLFLSRSVFVIFLAMNTLYFSNIIPPIPLSLRDAGAYHEVRRLNQNYILLKEHETIWDRITPGQTIHLSQGERLYVYSAIFAPTKLSTRIYHQWYYFDEATGGWEKRDRLSFAITGGRREGYRGYSVKSSVEQGKWRVSVETEQGQALGRVAFRVTNVSQQVPLTEEHKR